MSKKADTAAPAPEKAPALPVLSPERATMLLSAYARHVGAHASGGEITVDGVTHRARVVDGTIEIASEASVQSVSALRDGLRAVDRALMGTASRRRVADANARLGDDEAELAVRAAEDESALQKRADEREARIEAGLGETVVAFPIDALAFEVRA